MSRELDAQIARLVFGYHLLAPEQFGLTPVSDDSWVRGERTSTSIRFSKVPRYSTDMNAAWLVVEHLREQGYWLQVQDMRRFGVDEWEVEFCSGGRGKWTKADTLAEGICRAALMAATTTDEARP